MGRRGLAGESRQSYTFAASSVLASVEASVRQRLVPNSDFLWENQ